MRLVLISLVLATACSHSKPTPATSPVTGAEPWEVASGLYWRKLADVMDASGGSCAKLVEGLKSMEQESKELAATLVDAHHEFKEHHVTPETAERINKHGVILDRCEAEKTDGLGEALQITLFVVEPLKDDRSDSAYRNLFQPH